MKKLSNKTAGICHDLGILAAAICVFVASSVPTSLPVKMGIFVCLEIISMNALEFYSRKDDRLE
mgnify:CR=1 FL=1